MYIFRLLENILRLLEIYFQIIRDIFILIISDSKNRTLQDPKRCKSATPVECPSNKMDAGGVHC